ncbi:2-aminoadipate transaminase [compost metagenome]
MRADVVYPDLSPLVLAIPENPLRALFPYATRPGMLNLASGHPSRDAYDSEGLTEAIRRAAGDTAAWSYGPGAGDPELVAALEALSPPCPDGHRLIVTSGAQQAVDLALRSLARPGSTVLLPEPIYPAILSICAAAGLRVAAYRVNTNDPDLTDLRRVLEEREVAALYAQPTYSNPGGETWGLSARKRMLELCTVHSVPVIEDDPYRALCYAGVPPATLLELSAQIEGSLVIWAGSLSKMLAPGLRLGWSIMPEALARPMTELRQAGDLQPNALAQRVALRYLELGRLDAHLARVRGLYAARHERLAAVLGAAGFAFEPVKGGMFLFPVLPERAKVTGLFERALEQKVLYAPGTAFALERGHSRFGNRLRLCFAGLDAENLNTAAARLVTALRI